jgi:hypothetical protein
MGDVAPRRRTPLQSFPDPHHAHRVIELIAGDAASIECFTALKTGRDSKKISRCIHGAVSDPAIEKKLAAWSLDGFEIYVTAHLIRAGVTGNPKNADIEAGRVLFIDSDGALRPKRWHIRPDFILERADDPARSWWAFWIIDGAFPPDQIEPHQRELAALYGSDASVSDPRRIVRLPGYTRHEANETAGKKNAAKGDTFYRLVEGVGR